MPEELAAVATDPEHSSNLVALTRKVICIMLDLLSLSGSTSTLSE